MNRTRSLLGLLAALPLVAACGSTASAGQPAPPTTSTTHRFVDPSQIVLHLSDLGLGYITVPKDTKPVPLSEELKGDSAAARKADLAGYRGGYKTLFADGAKDGVLASAWEYKKSSYATVVVTDHQSIAKAAKEIHGAARSVPGAAPGIHRVLIAGKIPETGAMVPAYIYVWQHGASINLVLYFGVHATQARAIDIATQQDRRETTAGV